MQALYLLGTRQITSLNSDLSQLEHASQHEAPVSVLAGDDAQLRAGLLGQCVASLQAFQRTIDDYENMARRELVEEKRQKAEMCAQRGMRICQGVKTGTDTLRRRIVKFREDYANLRKHLDRLKQAHASEGAANDRASLLNGSASTSATTTPPWTSNGLSARRPIAANQPPAESPFTLSRAPTPQDGTSSASIGKAGYGGRTQAALDENSFLHSTGATLDQYITQGQAILQNLGSQRDIMKDAQRRLLSAANTLGLSRSTIAFIERRSKGDMYILLFGAVGTLAAFYWILRYLG